MVQLTTILSKYTPSWMFINRRKVFMRKQQLYKLTFSQKGRKRNCWKRAQINLYVQYRVEAEERQKNRLNIRHLNTQRIQAALDEHNCKFSDFSFKLPLLGVELDRKSLANLAIWEPRSFESLVEIVNKFDHNEYKNLK